MWYRLLNPYDDHTACWIHWPSIEPLWLRSDFHPFDPASLKRAYHDLWFRDIDHGRSHFTMGAITYDARRRAIMFVNGRNRTMLLSTLMESVPLALDDDALSAPDVQRTVRGSIRKSDLLLLPDLPILSYRELAGHSS